MRYHDTGSGEQIDTLANWIQHLCPDDIAELRIQVGYFRIDAACVLAQQLNFIAGRNINAHFIIGSNDGDTTHSDISKLANRLVLPNPNVKLSIVQFSNALFHPKVYHVKRKDGSQAAFVGSANFTKSGLVGLNVEAGISIDTACGDDEDLATKIAEAIDRWIDPSAEGVYQVETQDDIDLLRERGVLASVRLAVKTRPTKEEGQVGDGARGARRMKLVVLPPWPGSNGVPEEDDELNTEDVDTTYDLNDAAPMEDGDEGLQNVEHENDFALATETRDGFPSHILFKPNAIGPTVGLDALSGEPLPSDSVGLIMRLTRDSDRVFDGRPGTANISIPVAIARTFRFGAIPGPNGIDRPKAQFGLRLRYRSEAVGIDQAGGTNIMYYGPPVSEKGHKDLRMLLPRWPVEQIIEELRIQNQGLAVPKRGDLFFLEWPSDADDSFQLTLFPSVGVLATAAQQIYNGAQASGALIGKSCLLPAGVSPE